MGFNIWTSEKKSEDKKITEQFKVVKQTVQRELRRAYWKYVGDIVTPQENDSQHSRMKRFWTYIKHKRTDNKGIAPMQQNGLLPSEPTEQANILNKQFQSAFSEKQNYTKQEFQDKCQMEGNYHTAPEINITCPGVLKLLQTLNPNKAAGPDNIPVLKELAPEIAPILTIIFRKTGEIPPD